MTTETAAAPALPRLLIDAIDAKPIPFSFSAANFNADEDEDAGAWSIVYPDVSAWTPSQCYQWLRGQNYADPLGDWPTLDHVARGDVAAILETWRQAVRDGMANSPEQFEPMMNYAYPLPELRISPAEAQAALEQINTACVVVLINGDPWLALAGGGMDFSWDICRAYIALGYWPPAHFAGDLPRQGERDVRTAEICAEACRIARDWAVQRAARAERMLAETRIAAEPRDYDAL